MSNKNLNNKNEKHYTPEWILDFMWNILMENKIEATEWLENSSGDGRIIDFLKSKSNKNIMAFDIHNETNREDIIECDYLKRKIEYKPGRVGFINPPFTKGNKFIQKAMSECEYVVGIYAANTILTIDYDKYEAIGKIYYKNRVDFKSCVADICVILLKNR